MTDYFIEYYFEIFFFQEKIFFKKRNFSKNKKINIFNDILKKYNKNIINNIFKYYHQIDQNKIKISFAFESKKYNWFIKFIQFFSEKISEKLKKKYYEKNKRILIYDINDNFYQNIYLKNIYNGILNKIFSNDKKDIFYKKIIKKYQHLKLIEQISLISRIEKNMISKIYISEKNYKKL